MAPPLSYELVAADMAERAAKMFIVGTAGPGRSKLRAVAASATKGLVVAAASVVKAWSRAHIDALSQSFGNFDRAVGLGWLIGDALGWPELTRCQAHRAGASARTKAGAFEAEAQDDVRVVQRRAKEYPDARALQLAKEGAKAAVMKAAAPTIVIPPLEPRKRARPASPTAAQLSEATQLAAADAAAASKVLAKAERRARFASVIDPIERFEAAADRLKAARDLQHAELLEQSTKEAEEDARDEAKGMLRQQLSAEEAADEKAEQEARRAAKGRAAEARGLLAAREQAEVALLNALREDPSATWEDVVDEKRAACDAACGAYEVARAALLDPLNAAVTDAETAAAYTEARSDVVCATVDACHVRARDARRANLAMMEALPYQTDTIRRLVHAQSFVGKEAWDRYLQCGARGRTQGRSASVATRKRARRTSASGASWRMHGGIRRSACSWHAAR